MIVKNIEFYSKILDDESLETYDLLAKLEDEKNNSTELIEKLKELKRKVLVQESRSTNSIYEYDSFITDYELKSSTHAVAQNKFLENKINDTINCYKESCKCLGIIESILNNKKRKKTNTGSISKLYLYSKALDCNIKYNLIDFENPELQVIRKVNRKKYSTINSYCDSSCFDNVKVIGEDIKTLIKK